MKPLTMSDEPTICPDFRLPLPINLQCGAFITDSVMRLVGGVNPSGGELNVELKDGGKDSESSTAPKACNPLLWQANNGGLVDHKVMRRA